MHHKPEKMIAIPQEGSDELVRLVEIDRSESVRIGDRLTPQPLFEPLAEPFPDLYTLEPDDIHMWLDPKE